MIDFDKLTCEVATGAAVGIGVEDNNKTTFYLPLGYPTPTNAEEKKQAFFELYRLFKAYVTKNKLQPTDAQKRADGVLSEQEGYRLTVKDDDSVSMLYIKVNFLDTILDAFDSDAIQNIGNRKLYSDDFQLEDALAHLDDAVFMPNHAFMVDQAIVDQKQVLVEATELAQMFCFIYCDVKTQLQEADQVDSQHRFLADKFKELHLFPQASLFEQDSFEQVKTILKDRLELIDHNTPIKDGEYWKLRDAIYAFLYGEPVLGQQEDTYWGIKNFWPIWEDLCLESLYLIYSRLWLEDKVWLADTKRDDLFGEAKEIGTKNIFFKDDVNDYPFKISFSDQVKYLYPDLIFIALCSIDNYSHLYRVKFHHYWSNNFKEEDLINFYGNEKVKIYGYDNISLIKPEMEKDFISEDDAKKFLNEVAPIVIVDFKYKVNVSPSDLIKQYLYLSSTKNYSLGEFWIPCSSAKDCNETIPYQDGDFKNKKRQEIMIRKINIKNLVLSYIRGDNVK